MTPGQIQTLEDNRDLWVLMRDHGYLPNGTQHRVQAVVNVYVALTGSIPNSAMIAMAKSFKLVTR